LGFVVDENGLSPDPRLVEAIAHRREPQNTKAVSSFLGLTGYYRRFVQDYAKIAEPLTRLLAKTVRFSWGAEQQLAFDTLKERLITYPILRRPDLDRPFIVHTDASSKAVGAILAQQDETGREHVVAYHSKKLTATQRNWPISQLECYAVVNAVCDHWADFLLGSPFLVYTDCVALRWLMSSPQLQGKLARWSLRLQEFLPFEIQYRKGVLHRAPDALTRYASYDEPEPPTETTGTAPLDLPEEILTTQEAPAGPAVTPRTAGLSGDTTTPGSVNSHSAFVNSVEEAIKSAVRICVEGNIGCGKSSVMEALQEKQIADPTWQEFTIIPEPVHKWHHLLGPLYAAPPRTMERHSIAAMLQIAVLNAYALRVPSPLFAPTVLTERSTWSSLSVFLPVQALPPSLEQVVKQTAHHMYPNVDNALPTAIIYLKADPETCIQRIQQRQRPGENMLSLEYITRLHQQYEQEVTAFPGPVITIDANKSKEAVAAAVKCAVELLTGAGATTSPKPAPHHTQRVASPPFLVEDFPSLTRLFSGQLLTTCDPYLLRLFPEQLLTLEEAPAQPVAESSLTSATPEAVTATRSHHTVPYEPYAFEPTPMGILFDGDYEVLALFQNGPGKFCYSPQFCAEYLRRHHSAVDTGHRVNNTKALQLYAELGPWLSNGPDANIHHGP
jgi:deoxyadenosine/deoxycytidine kinase